MTKPVKNHHVEVDLLYDVISRTLTNSDWTVARAAELLHLSRRQVYRLKAAVRKEGRTGLNHGNQGRRPVNAAPVRVHEQVVQLYKRTYGPEGYGLAHFAEALAEEHGVSLSRETVRKWRRSDSSVISACSPARSDGDYAQPILVEASRISPAARQEAAPGA
jgi:transposase